MTAAITFITLVPGTTKAILLGVGKGRDSLHTGPKRPSGRSPTQSAVGRSEREIAYDIRYGRIDSPDSLSDLSLMTFAGFGSVINSSYSCRQLQFRLTSRALCYPESRVVHVDSDLHKLLNYRHQRKTNCQRMES